MSAMSTSAHPMMASQSIDAAVLALLWERYGVSPGAAATLELLGDEYGKHILAARAGNGAGGEHLPDGTPALPWVVRVCPPLRRPEAREAHAPDALAAHARVLRLLAAYGYPAPRVVPAANGALLTSLGEGAAARPVLVTTYVEGRAAGLALAGLRAHGETL